MCKKRQIADFKDFCPGPKTQKCAETSPGTPIYIIKPQKEDYQPNRPRTRSMNDGRCCVDMDSFTFGDLRSRNIIDDEW